MSAIRRPAALAPGLALALALVVAGGGWSCSSPPPPARGSVVADRAMPSPVNRVEALRGAVRAGDDAALAHLAELTLRHADDPAVRAAALQAAVAGSREAELFAQLIGPAGHDSRDLGGVLREFAAAAGRTGRPDAALSVVREVSGRECCLRRSLLTGSLDGLSEGLAAVRFAPVRQAEAAMRLAELAANHDPEVARAARRAAAFFVLPERRP